MGRGTTAAIKAPLPPGVEIHGKSLRICFTFKGVRCREALGLEPTAKNIKYAANFRSTILHSISTRSFKYHEHFPDSPKSHLFDESKSIIKKITLDDLSTLYKKSKSLGRTEKSIDDLVFAMNVIIPLLGGKEKIVCTLSADDIDSFLLGLREGRKISTFNDRLQYAIGLLKFAQERNYIEKSPLNSSMYLKPDSVDSVPDPLERDEFQSLISACNNEFYKQLFTFSVYTGIRRC